MSSKKITVISGNYYPEDTAIGLYTTQLTEHLIKKGFEINVITNFPYYPQWKIWNDYHDKPNFFSELLHTIKIYRYKQFVPKKVSFLGRVLLMLSFLYGAIVNSKKIKEADLIICIIPFTLSLIPGLLLKRKCKAKLWVHIQDFEFDLAFETGILKKNNLIITLFKKIIFSFESYLLNKSDVISSISNNMIATSKTKSNVENLFLFPNWVSSTNINPESSKPHPYISKDKFTLLYSGNVGEKQDWSVLENICALIHSDDIDVIIVGEGAFLPQLKQNLSQYPFVKFFPLVPYHELSDLLCSADVHFLFQKTDVKDSIMPSKILGMMASEKPSLITGNKTSEVGTIFNNHLVGCYFSDLDIQTIYNTIIQLKDNADLRKKMGQNARSYVIENFSENIIFEKVEKKLDEELNNSKS